MANPYNPPRSRGERKHKKPPFKAQIIRSQDGHGFGPSRRYSQDSGINNTALIEQGATLMQCSEGREETAEDYLIPRRSLTRKQHLEAFPVPMETERLSPVKRIQTTKDGSKVETTDPGKIRVIWKGDRNLLTPGKPTRDLDRMPFYRVTGNTKRRQFQPELPAIKEISLDDPLNDTDPNFPIFPSESK